jgi:hypothetical protein
MIRTAPPRAEQVWRSIPKTGSERQVCAHLLSLMHSH